MTRREFAVQLCWFLTCMLALSCYGLLLAWIDTGTALEASPGRIMLLLMSAGSIVIMIVLIVVAFRLEQRSEGRPGR